MNQLQFENIPLKDITPDPNQPRKFYEEHAMQELTDSVRESGVVQPILVRKNPAGKGYLLVCGERRYRASKAVQVLHKDRSTIPAVVRELTDDEALQLQIIENLQRKDVHPMEEAVAFKSFQEGKNWSVEEIAKRVGKSEYYVKQRIKLNSMIQAFQDMFFRNQMAIKTAIDLAQTDPEIQKQIFEDRVDEDDLANEGFKLELGTWVWKKYRGNLNHAPFDTGNKTLNSAMGACTSCQFNSAVSKLFPEEGESTCGNLNCFKQKAEKSYTLNLQASQDDPSIVLITGQYQADTDTKKLMSKIEGIIEYSGYEKEEAPEYPERDDFEGNNDTAEEDEQEFQDAIKEYHEDLEKWNAKVAAGGYIKAFIVGGGDKGKFTYVKLKKAAPQKTKSAAVTGSTPDAPSGITAAEIDEEISRLKEREKRAKELDYEKVQTRIADDVKKSDLTENITGSFMQRSYERYLIFSLVDFYLTDKMMKEFKLKHDYNYKNPVDVIDALNALTPQQYITLIRLAVRHKFASIVTANSKGAYITRLLAEDLKTIPIEAYETEQNDKATKRAAKVEKRIKELQEQKKELKASQPKPAKAKK